MYCEMVWNEKDSVSPLKLLKGKKKGEPVGEEGVQAFVAMLHVLLCKLELMLCDQSIRGTWE